MLGAVAAHAGLDAETLVRVAVYDDMAGGVAALLKLEPGDPVDGVRLVIDACAAVDPLISQLAALDLTRGDPCGERPPSRGVDRSPRHHE